MEVNEKHFKKVNLFSFKGFDDSITLEDNTFSDITFDEFHCIGVKKIHSNASNRTANKLQTIFCWDCEVEHQPPKYDLQKV